MGRFGRCEVAVLGNTCEGVSDFYLSLSKAQPEMVLAYADASHVSGDGLEAGIVFRQNERSVVVEKAGVLEFPDRIISLGEANAVVVNGNHFEAARQLIIPHPEKEQSLRKRAAQISDPIAIFLQGEMSEVPAWVDGVLNGRKIPVIYAADTEAMNTLWKLIYTPPALKALVLTGGMSTRMGEDKARIQYHGMPQSEYLSEALKGVGLPVVFSCRLDQVDYFESKGERTITDRILGIGPLCGILSAWMSEPDTAWMVIACDMPGWNEDAIRALTAARNPGKLATAFALEPTRPEPLAAIWEPTIYQRVLQCLSVGVDCPRKILRSSRIKEVAPSDPRWVYNINTPDEAGEYREMKA